MELEKKMLNIILKNLNLFNHSNIQGLEKIKKSICILHNEYLLGSSRELGILLEKYPCKKNEDIFLLLMSIYNKRIKIHHSLFLIIHIFETALRSKVATILSAHYSNNLQDDWFLLNAHVKLTHKINKIKDIHNIKSFCEYNSFEVLNLFTLGDLEQTIKHQWQIFKPIFGDEKVYKNQKLPQYGTKEHLLKTFIMIRKARNDLFHNNPPKIKIKSIVKNIEILLLRLDFNLYDAFKNIASLEHSIKLYYNYK